MAPWRRPDSGVTDYSPIHISKMVLPTVKIGPPLEQEREAVGAGRYTWGRSSLRQRWPPPARPCMRPFCVSGPGGRGSLHSVNRWLRSRSLASSSSAIMCFTLGRTRPSAQRHTVGRKVPMRRRSPTTTGPIPPGTALAAPGSRRESRRSFSCTVCPVSALSRSFRRAHRRPLRRRRRYRPPSSSGTESRLPPSRSLPEIERVSGQGRVRPCQTSMYAGFFVVWKMPASLIPPVLGQRFEAGWRAACRPRCRWRGWMHSPR